ncbi:hypothetical protein [Rhizobium sp. 42MFCr.1]|uniref:hypothetical protein n=1 Tax=Rhizobium sp. 42MFCr.1 TaxID=1048680 RepID=UPI00037C4116|nr:hypothetical protein [Rhizobium sp. 42MFCr.1]
MHSPIDTTKAPLYRDKLLYVVQAALTALCLAVLLRIWRFDLGIPFSYQGDAIFELALVKSIASGGWIWSISDLGAPFGFEAASFPQNITASSSVMRILAVFSENPAKILNLYWLLSCILTSIVCCYSLRLFRFEWPVVLLASTLYALLPYAFERNIAHISLTYAFVPVICAHCLKIVSGREVERYSNKYRIILATACIVLGFDYIYNAFFACFFVCCSVAVAFCLRRDLRAVRSGAIVVAAICMFSVANFLPSAFTWMENGLPPGMNYKSASEAESYGLKIRQVISPAALDRYASKAQFPLENENRFARLGIVLGLGYLSSILYAIFAQCGRDPVRWAAGVLVLFGTLLATVGGFGAIFNLLVAPDIRAYNRIIVFLAFFSAVVLSGLLSDWLDFIDRRPFFRTRQWAKRSTSVALIGSTFLIGLIDQGDAARQLMNRYDLDKAQAVDEADLVARMQARVPRVTQVYQLPERPFPLDAGKDRMGTYDHGRPFLWSEKIRWSWPSFSYRSEAWHERIGSLSDPQFVENLIVSGFNGLWLDRYGYSDQELPEIEAMLQRQIGIPNLESTSKRYAFFDLSRKAASIASDGGGRIADRTEAMLEAPFLGFPRGVYPQEIGASGELIRWSQRKSRVLIGNPSSGTRQLRFASAFRSLPGGQLHVVGSGVDRVIDMQSGNGDFSVSIALEGKQTTTLTFEYKGGRVFANGDARIMYFGLVNPTLKED